jgi:uncharacterized membrane protein
MSNVESELQKEFELERMILFSDAVFAIAITLLIIEIKFPEIERGATSHEVLHQFKPVIIRFIGFILSFFFIGVMWARHLKIFKYLRSYDSGVILRNLILLFFIVCFPFTASGLTENIRPGFVLPIVVYAINICCVMLAQYALCRYMFKARPQLSVPGQEMEKRYLLLQSKFTAMVLTCTTLLIVMLTLIFPGNNLYVLYGFYAIPISMLFVRKYLKKLKPVGAR